MEEQLKEMEKLHVIIDEKTQEIISEVSTASSVSDGKESHFCMGGRFLENPDEFLQILKDLPSFLHHRCRHIMLLTEFHQEVRALTLDARIL